MSVSVHASVCTERHCMVSHKMDKRDLVPHPHRTLHLHGAKVVNTLKDE